MASKHNPPAARAALGLVLRNNLRRRLGQNILIGLMVAISSLLFAVALGIMGGLDRPFERMSESAKASHLIMVVDAEVYDPSRLADWWLAQAETRGVTRYDVVYSNDLKPFFEGKQLATMVSYAEFKPGNQQDLLRVVKGPAGDRALAGPALDEVWLPTSLANQYGLNPGDSLGLPVGRGMVDFRVGAIVVDPQFSSGYANPVRIWLAPGALAMHFPAASLHQELLAVRLADPALCPALSARFNEFLGGAFNGISYDWTMIRFGFLWLLQMIGAAMLVFSVLAALACVLLVHNTIAQAVRHDYRQVGILKSMGFTPGQLSGAYVLQYLLVAGLALVPGSVLAWFLSSRMLESLSLALGVDAGGGLGGLGPALAAVPVFLGLVAIASGLSSRAAGRISAVEAIRFGTNPDAARPRKPRAERRLFTLGLPPVVLLALRSLSQQRRRSVASLAALLFAAFVMLIANDTLSLFAGIGDDLGRWGFVDSDLSLARNGRRFPLSHETLMADLAARPAVRLVLPQEQIDAATPPLDGQPGMLLYGNVFDGDPALIGQTNVEGRHPQAADEISLGSRTAAAYGAQLGDTVKLFIYGQELSYRVTGVFQTIGNLGHGFRLSAEGFRRANPGWVPSHYELMLRDPAERPALVAALEASWGEALEPLDMRSTVRQITNGMVAGLSGAFILMTLIFLGVALVAVANGSAMEIHESLRNLALLKTMGYSPGQLRAALAIKFGLVGLLGGMLALALSWLAEPGLFRASFGAMGLVDYQPSLSAAPVLVIGLVSLFAALSTRLPSRKLRTIPVRSLIVE